MSAESDCEFVLSKEAFEDLDRIWLYIAQDSVDAADRVEEALRSAMRMLGERPEAGQFWPVFSYLVVYDPKKRPVEIVKNLMAPALPPVPQTD